MSSKQSNSLDTSRDADHETYKIIGSLHLEAVDYWKRSMVIDDDDNKSDDDVYDEHVKHLVHAKVACNLAKL